MQLNSILAGDRYVRRQVIEPDQPSDAQDEVSERVVRCASCLSLLAEPPNTPPEHRIPCPNCGSTARNYAITLSASIVPQADLVIQVSPATVRLGAPAPQIEVVKPEIVIGNLDDAGFALRWLKLSEGGAWMLRAFDQKGTYVAGTVQDNPQDALLAIAEELLPPSQPPKR